MERNTEESLVAINDKAEDLLAYTDGDDPQEILFHCKQEKCEGIWFVDITDGRTTYKCPVCERYNCITCHTIHEGVPCDEYNARLKYLVPDESITWKCEFCEYNENLTETAICVICLRINDKIMDTRKYAATEHYRLFELEESNNFIPSFEKFECTICTETIEPNNGVQLRGCLHHFCFTCIRKYIEGSDQPEMKCPLFDCTNFLEDREIKTLVSLEGYTRYLEMSLRVGKSQFPNGYQCCVANCQGWWIYSNNTYSYDCPVCQTSNCISCKASHPNIDCKTYQVHGYFSKDQNDIKTRETLEELLSEGLAEQCPQCNIIVEKNGGCEHMVCTMCQAKFNWGVNTKKKLKIT